MRSEDAIDVEDLLARCRAENAKRALGEAVASFRAGAYRACIVVAWTAVVFDYVGKLQELELLGNGEAAKALEAWENARRNSDVTLSMRLEEDLLTEAERRFDLLTPIERQDLERLRSDRHRCAHPSLLTLDEPYQPSAELARVHLRHAVTHLLGRPPVQGKEAWDRIWADVSSNTFPEHVDTATERLSSLLSRARPSLVRKLAIELTRKLLSRSEEANHARLDAAFAATAKLHHAEGEHASQPEARVLAERVPDDDLRSPELLPSRGAGLAVHQWPKPRPPSSLCGTNRDHQQTSPAQPTSSRWGAVTSRIPTLDDKALVTFAKKRNELTCLRRSSDDSRRPRLCSRGSATCAAGLGEGFDPPGRRRNGSDWSSRSTSTRT